VITFIYNTTVFEFAKRGLSHCEMQPTTKHAHTFHFIKPWSKILLTRPLVAEIVNILQLLWKAKIYYRVLDSPFLIRIKSQMNPLQIVTSDSSRIRFNIILSSIPSPRNWSCLLWLYDHLELISFSPMRRFTKWLAHIIIFDFTILVFWK
jgi:hypothetical protein